MGAVQFFRFHELDSQKSLIDLTDCTLLKITCLMQFKSEVCYENGIDSKDYMPCSFAFSHLADIFSAFKVRYVIEFSK